MTAMALQSDHRHVFIDGEWREPLSAEILEVTSSATEETIGSVPLGGSADVEVAIAAARRAFDHGPWPRMTGKERGAVLSAMAGSLFGRADEIALTVSSEVGTPIAWGASGQALAPAGLLHYYAELVSDPLEERRQGRDANVLVVREPVGVVGAIVPFNVPLMIAAAKVGPALAAGCTIVVKAPPEAPLSFIALAQAAIDAALPSGVLNIVPGGVEAGDALVGHPSIDKISFTGSGTVGAAIAAKSGAKLQRVMLELGGKSASIVLDDVDVVGLADGLIGVGLMNNGQACAAQTRILVPAARYDEVVGALVQGVADLVVGLPTDAATQVGPLVSERQRDKVLAFIQAGIDEGAVVATGGGRPAAFDRGWFVEPTVFTGVSNDMTIGREEIFGPVLSVISYDGSDDEAVDIANDSPYGLAGSVWTSDPERGLAVARRVRTGNFGINRMGVDLGSPFGGFKQSGFGREFGPEGLDGYTELKTIVGLT